MVRIASIALGGLLLATASMSSAAVTRISEGNFIAGAGLITFSEFEIGATNPFYSSADYGGDASAPDVSFGGYFHGQSLSTDPTNDCPGAAASACVVGTPTAALSLDADSPDTFITTDASNPTSPVLSGSPTFSGPIAVLFSDDQYGVGFDAGYFDALASTAITAFDRAGNLIGSVSNTGIGVEFLGLVTDDNTASIAGVFLDLIGAEPAGFAIDNIRFGLQDDIIAPPPVNAAVPIPAPAFLLAGGLAALFGLRRRT